LVVGGLNEDPNTLPDNALASAEIFAEPPAQVESVVVNDGSAQRSMVTRLTVTFDRVVALDPGAFELDQEGGGPIDVQVSGSVVKKSAGDAGFLWYFDFDGDGDVDGWDNGQFNRRFGQF